MLFHRSQKLLRFFVFLPWLSFWNQGGSRIADYSHLQIGVSSDAACKHVRKFRTTLVRTPQSRAKGLSQRSARLAHDETMLFVFEEPQKVAFWMKDTLIPLELALFDAKGTLSQVFEMPVERDPVNPTKRYQASALAIAGLELAPDALKGLSPGHAHLCASTRSP